jgi:transposase-like protein
MHSTFTAAGVTRNDQRARVAADVRAIFNEPSRVAAEELLQRTVASWRKTAPRLAEWMEENIPEGLTVFDEKLGLSEAARRHLRTTNGLERVNTEIKRRTCVAALFPNEESILRLVSALLMEISEEWEAGRVYIANEESD